MDAVRSRPVRPPVPQLRCPRACTAPAKRDARPVHLACNRPDRFKVALRGDRKAGLEHVHAQRRKLVRHAQLLAVVHGASGALLAVPQRRIEEIQCAGALPASSPTFGSHGMIRHIPLVPVFHQHNAGLYLRHLVSSFLILLLLTPMLSASSPAPAFPARCPGHQHSPSAADLARAEHAPT